MRSTLHILHFKAGCSNRLLENLPVDFIMARNAQGHTALHAAVLHRRNSVAKMLLSIIVKCAPALFFPLRVPFLYYSRYRSFRPFSFVSVFVCAISLRHSTLRCCTGVDWYSDFLACSQMTPQIRFTSTVLAHSEFTPPASFQALRTKEFLHEHFAITIMNTLLL